MTNFDDFVNDQISWKHAQRQPFVFAFYSKISVFLGNQDYCKNTKWNLFKNHPISDKAMLMPSATNGRFIVPWFELTRMSHKFNRSWPWMLQKLSKCSERKVAKSIDKRILLKYMRNTILCFTNSCILNGSTWINAVRGKFHLYISTVIGWAKSADF